MRLRTLAHTEMGDHEEANAAFRRLAATYRELRSLGPDALSSLLPLLTHNNVAVRCWAATHSLEFAPTLAEPVLAKIAQGPGGFVRLDAEMTLDQWHKGELKFP